VQTNHVIKLTDIHKVYHTGEVDVHAVRGITLAVFPGEFVALMGASGSGKSTLMNMIGALAEADEFQRVQGVIALLVRRDAVPVVKHRHLDIFQRRRA